MFQDVTGSCSARLRATMSRAISSIFLVQTGASPGHVLARGDRHLALQGPGDALP